jgi:phosphotriesterase-related protein
MQGCLSPSQLVEQAEPSRLVTCVLGNVRPEALGVVDAHNHLWIEPVAGAAPGSPVLADLARITAELREYRRLGGGGIVDCQPGGCGRNGSRLADLSRQTGVAVVACTGFHRRRYYHPDYWLWQASLEQAADFFISEIRTGLVETLEAGQPVRAGFIKIACEASLEETPQAPLEAAAAAAAATGAAVEVHTEQGAGAERIVAYFGSHGVPPERLVLCHIDKRPDLGLHLELARAGVLLEYDTFYRPKYRPDAGVWRLVAGMIEHGMHGQVAVATDMAEAALWTAYGGSPGLTGLLTILRPGLEAIILSSDAATDDAVCQMIGKNIACRLSISLL